MNKGFHFSGLQLFGRFGWKLRNAKLFRQYFSCGGEHKVIGLEPVKGQNQGV